MRPVGKQAPNWSCDREIAVRPDRALHTAVRLEALSIAWMVVEAGGAIGAGIAAHSVLLAAFGVDSVIELISAVVLFRQLRQEAAGTQTGDELEATKRLASQIAGGLLYLLAGYVVLQSGYGLLHRNQAERSWLGLAIAGIAALGMPVLAKAKIRVAEEIGNQALRADAMETFTCGYLSWVLLFGLAANALLRWWWLDSAAALVLVPLLIKEGREAITGECGCRGDTDE
jgi:divalent metal cation (Fe/Co/Zn/Cd) transporter